MRLRRGTSARSRFRTGCCRPGCCHLGSPIRWRARGRGMPRVGWAAPFGSTGRQEKRDLLRPRQSFVGSLKTAASFIRPITCATGVQAMDVQPWTSKRSPSGRAGVQPGRRPEGSAYSRIDRDQMSLSGSTAETLHARLHRARAVEQRARLPSCRSMEAVYHGTRSVGLRDPEFAGLRAQVFEFAGVASRSVCADSADKSVLTRWSHSRPCAENPDWAHRGEFQRRDNRYSRDALRLPENDSPGGYLAADATRCRSGARRSGAR